jgi:hypothetical protein
VDTQLFERFEESSAVFEREPTPWSPLCMELMIRIASPAEMPCAIRSAMVITSSSLIGWDLARNGAEEEMDGAVDSGTSMV